MPTAAQDTSYLAIRVNNLEKMYKIRWLINFCLLSIAVGEVFGLQSFIDHELVPDILSSPPANVLSVTFPNGIQALEGNELTPDDVTGVPILKWNVNPERFYTIVMCDADAPSRVSPDARSYLHWLVVNVPGEDIDSGRTVVPILNSHPGPKTGLHRYVFLVYEQGEEMEFNELPNESFEGRKGFSPELFADKHGFGPLVAGNFYQTETIEDNDERIYS